MDAGIIASRYAKALYRFAAEEGCTDSVYAETVRLMEAVRLVPGLRESLFDTVMVAPGRKPELVRSALGGAVTPVMDKFIRLVALKGRMAFIPLIFKDFASLYYKEKGIIPATLTTATPAGESLLSSLKALVKNSIGLDAEIRTVVDPALIGGFVFDLGDKILDASVASQLEKIRRSFMDKNRRIV